MFGKIVSSLLLLIGVGLQVFVPSHIIDVSGWSILGVPDQLTAIFVSLLFICAGLIGLYLFHYKFYAQKLDKKKV